MKEKQLVFSIIVPVFNAEKHLHDCLESLTNQGTSPEIYEILCIDDGSTDNSCRIIRSFSDKFENIRYYYQNNSGVSVARNKGIEIARGKYIWFVDADDYVSKDSLAILRPIIDKQKYDRVVFRFYITSFTYKAYQSDPHIDKQLNPRKTDGSVWTSIYKRDFLEDNRLFFRKGIQAGEDSLFNYEFYKKKGKQKFIEDTLYFYRINELSVTKSKSNNEKVLESHLLCAEIVKHYFESETTKEPRTIRYIFGELEYVMSLIASLSSEKRKKYLSSIIVNSLFPVFLGKPLILSIYSNIHGFHLRLICALSKVDIFSWIIKMWARIHNSKIRKDTIKRVKQLIIKA